VTETEGRMKDPILHRAARLRRTSNGEKRALVCLGCVTDADFVFGGVHSDRACARCRKEPIGQGGGRGTLPVGGRRAGPVA
jgi:hypothetical protein